MLLLQNDARAHALLCQMEDRAEIAKLNAARASLASESQSTSAEMLETIKESCLIRQTLMRPSEPERGIVGSERYQADLAAREKYGEVTELLDRRKTVRARRELGWRNTACKNRGYREAESAEIDPNSIWRT